MTSIPIEAELTLFRDELVAFKRRKSRRFRCNLATLGRVHLGNRPDGRDAFVFNLSEHGVGLNMAEPLAVGQEIIVRIRVRGQPRQYRAQVMHATQEVDRTWRIGCAFKEIMTRQELDQILE